MFEKHIDLLELSSQADDKMRCELEEQAVIDDGFRAI